MHTSFPMLVADKTILLICITERKGKHDLDYNLHKHEISDEGNIKFAHEKLATKTLVNHNHNHNPD